MNCDVCSGQYQEKLVTRSYLHKGRPVVVDRVPALVCDRCGDVLIREEVSAAIEEILEKGLEPQEYAPVYCFPAKVA